ncbi:MAG: lysylphosphatidylglycerol synthase domain-containing protein, partial [Actinomycetota bacterium]|nr:lysylphosphatidylglycerol synthase domain-containing protein [Actinomycetota bacterium]
MAVHELDRVSVRGSRLKGVARAVWIIALTVFVVRYTADNWDGITEQVQRLGPLDAVLVVAVTMLGKVLVGEQVRLSAEVLGASISRRRANWIYSASDMAKYVPGGVWNAMARVKMLQADGLSVADSSRAFLLEKVWQVTGAFFAAMLTARAALHERVLGSWAVDSRLLVTATFLACITAWIGVTWLATRWTNGKAQRKRMTARAITDQFLLAVLLGLGIWIPLRSLGYDDLWLAVGAFALGRAAGYVAVFAPAGVGVREAVSIWLLTTAVP